MMSEQSRQDGWRAGAVRRMHRPRVRALFDRVPIGLYRTTREGRILNANPALAHLLGYADVNELLATPAPSLYMDYQQRAAEMRVVEATRAPLVSEICLRRKDGRPIWVRDTFCPVYDAVGRFRYFEGSLEDITERKAAEAQSGRINRGLLMVVKCHEAIAHTRDEVGLFDQVCGILADVGGYGVAWVTRVEADAQKTVRVIAQRGLLRECLDESAVSGGHDPAAGGLVGAAIRASAICHVRDVLTDPRFPACRGQALAGGIRSMLVLPLIRRGRVMAELGLGYNEVDPFDDEEVHYLKALTEDVALGVASLRTDAERDELLEALFVSERRLREMLESVQLVVVGLDSDGGITFCNEYLLRVAEMRRPEVIGANWFERFVPADQQVQARAAFAQLLGVASVSGFFESDLLTARGERRTISWNFTTTRDMNASVIGVTGIGEDITDRLRMSAARDELLTQVVAAHERLQSLSRQLVRVQEEERRRLARELHDEIGQSLTGLKILIDVAVKSPAAAGANLRAALSLLNELIGKVRALSLDLRPGLLDDLGLLPALLWLIDRYTQQTNIQVSFHHARLEDRRFPSEIETAAYRIVQEALTNVARHAQTDQAAVQVRVAETALYIEVQDQGGGFDAATALGTGYAAGLSGLRERTELLSGRLVIESAPGRGTRVTAELPIV